MAKKTDKTPDAYMVLENGEPLRVYENHDDALSYIGSRVVSGGDLPQFQVVPVVEVEYGK